MKSNSSQRKLAEIVGIMLGDGCLYFDKYRKYQTIVSFGKNEKSYLRYVQKLFQNYFLGYKFCITEIKTEFLLRNTSVFVGNELVDSGLIPGNKIKNNLSIPSWVFTDKPTLFRCVRGLFDTDGSVYCKYNHYAQIQFKLACLPMIRSLHNAVVDIGFNPTKIQREDYKGRTSWKFYLSRQKEIDLFFARIQPKNSKHLERYAKIRKWGHRDLNPDPVVSSSA